MRPPPANPAAASRAAEPSDAGERPHDRGCRHRARPPSGHPDRDGRQARHAWPNDPGADHQWEGMLSGSAVAGCCPESVARKHAVPPRQQHRRARTGGRQGFRIAPKALGLASCFGCLAGRRGSHDHHPVLGEFPVRAEVRADEAPLGAGRQGRRGVIGVRSHRRHHGRGLDEDLHAGVIGYDEDGPWICHRAPASRTRRPRRPFHVAKEAPVFREAEPRRKKSRRPNPSTRRPPLLRRMDATPEAGEIRHQ